MSDVFDRISTLLAVREYSDRAIPDDLVRRILEAGWLTGSSMNRQPWHFVAVRDRALLTRLGELVSSGRYTAQAQLAVVVAHEKESRFGVSDASRAIQSMMLAAWDEGVGSNWTGFGGLEEVRALVGLDDTYEVLAVIPFGYPANPDLKGIKKRRPFDEVVSQDRAGIPLS